MINDSSNCNEILDDLAEVKDFAVAVVGGSDHDGAVPGNNINGERLTK
jgi:selenophosphate synthetase-related protein